MSFHWNLLGMQHAYLDVFLHNSFVELSGRATKFIEWHESVVDLEVVVDNATVAAQNTSETKPRQDHVSSGKNKLHLGISNCNRICQLTVYLYLQFQT